MANYNKLNGEVAYDIGCEIEQLRKVLFESIELDDRPELRKYVQKQIHHSLEYYMQVLKSVRHEKECTNTFKHILIKPKVGSVVRITDSTEDACFDRIGETYKVTFTNICDVDGNELSKVILNNSFVVDLTQTTLEVVS